VYSALVYSSGKVARLYGSFIEANVETRSWSYLDADVVGPMVHSFQPNADSQGLHEDTQAVVDPRTGYAFVTVNPGSAGDNWRNFVLAIDLPHRSLAFGVGPPTSDVDLVGNESIGMVGRNVVILGGRRTSSAVPSILDRGWYFNAEVGKGSQKYFKLTGDRPAMSGPGATQENVPFFSDGTNVYLWEYSTADRDAFYRFALTPSSGSGTAADPYLFTTTRIALSPSNMPDPDLTYRLDYIAEWGVVVLQVNSESKLWAIRL
jgi:hypothetical protein